MEVVHQFFWGVFGSVAVEVVCLVQACKGGNPLPKHVQEPGYWALRLLQAIIAGFLAVAFQAANPLVALEIGAAVPAIVLSWEHRRDLSKFKK
jgi:fructose-specific phosphotransferase system IIC component